MFPYQDMRQFLQDVEELDELQVVHGADREKDIGLLTEMMAERKGAALLFDKIKGYPPGYRVATNLVTTVRRTALALGLPLDTPALELLRYWKGKLRDFKTVPPVEVEDAPVKENILTGDEVDLLKIPTPRWHPLDGGPFIGTADAVITQDPEEGWVNLGTYRVQVYDSKTAGMAGNVGKHGKLMMEKYWAQGKSCPVAVSVGHSPTLFMPCPGNLPYGMNAYEFVGWLQGEPVQVTRGVATGLPIPATAEIVIEGEVPPPEVEQRDEGPFGDSEGFYSPWPKGQPKPVLRVKAILHRNDPILYGACPIKPFKGDWSTGIPVRAGATWFAVEQAGIPGVKGVWHFGSNFPQIAVISIKQMFPGHAKLAGMATAASLGTGYKNKYTIVVDDDIDLTSLGDVLWAVGTRSDPATGIDFMRETWTTLGDVAVSDELKKALVHTNSRAIVIACKPYARRGTFPATYEYSAEARQEARRKWPQLFKE